MIWVYFGMEYGGCNHMEGSLVNRSWTQTATIFARKWLLYQHIFDVILPPKWVVISPKPWKMHSSTTVNVTSSSACSTSTLPRVEPPQGDSAQGAGGHHGEGPDPGHEGGAGAAVPQQRVPSNPATSRPWPCVMWDGGILCSMGKLLLLDQPGDDAFSVVSEFYSLDED